MWSVGGWGQEKAGKSEAGGGGKGSSLPIAWLLLNSVYKNFQLV